MSEKAEIIANVAVLLLGVATTYFVIFAANLWVNQ